MKWTTNSDREALFMLTPDGTYVPLFGCMVVAVDTAKVDMDNLDFVMQDLAADIGVPGAYIIEVL